MLIVVNNRLYEKVITIKALTRLFHCEVNLCGMAYIFNEVVTSAIYKQKLAFLMMSLSTIL